MLSIQIAKGTNDLATFNYGRWRFKATKSPNCYILLTKQIKSLRDISEAIPIMHLELRRLKNTRLTQRSRLTRNRSITKGYPPRNCSCKFLPLRCESEGSWPRQNWCSRVHWRQCSRRTPEAIPGHSSYSSSPFTVHRVQRPILQHQNCARRRWCLRCDWGCCICN